MTEGKLCVVLEDEKRFYFVCHHDLPEDSMIYPKPSYEELEQRVNILTNEALERDRSEKEIERIFNFSIDMVGSGNLQGYFTKINASFEEVLGYSEKEILENPFINFVHDDDVEKTKKALADAAKGKKNIYIENRYKCKDGSYKWIEWKVLPIVKENKFIAVGRDVTERKRRDEVLKKSEERFRNLTEMTSDWIWEVDKDGCYTYASPKVNDILGYDPDEIIGKTPFDLMPPKEAKQVFKIFNNIIASKRSFDCLENVNLHKNGHPVVIETSGTPIFSADGEFLGYRGIDRDITNRKQTEKALRESEERYRSLAENSSVGIWQTTLDGHTIYINPAMCRILEIEDPEELHIKSFHSFYDAENLEIVKREIAKCEKGISSTYEVKITGRKGTRRSVMISGAPIFLSEGQIHSAIGTFIDITEKKRAELALMKAHNDLDRRIKERTAELDDALKTIKRSEKELIERKSALEILNRELLETNQAVSVLARNIDRKKEELERKVYEICSGKIMPILKKLQNDAYCKKRQADLELILNYINEIVHETPIIHSISSHLTEQELRVAMLVKNGLTSEKIADMLNISLHTVKTHRRNIRKKLKIENEDINLISYLKSRLKSDPIQKSKLP